MALQTGTIWEARPTGNNANGGGWFDAGGASVDYSEQDAPELSVADAVTNGTTTVTSATGGFTAAMVGSIINIVTKGRFEIKVVTDGNTITIDRTATAGSGLTANVGGAVADLEEIDTGCPMGTIWLKAGTYNLAGQIYFSTSAAGARFIRGYNTTRGDDPEGNDRPLLACGTWNVRFFTANYVYNIRFEGAVNGNLVWFSNGYCGLFNCYVRNSHALANKYALYPNSLTIVSDCELICDNGIALGPGNVMVLDSYIHDSSRAFLAAAGADYVGNIIESMSNMGGALGNGCMFRHNTIYNCVNEGIEEISQWSFLLNNQFISNGTGIKTTDTNNRSRVDVNNYFGNTLDVDGLSKGPNATANDPGFAGLISGTDLVCSDHAGPEYTVTSALGAFDSEMVGKSITITDTGVGGHFVVGNYMVAAFVSVTEITLETDPTDGTNETGGDWESCYDFSSVDDADGFTIRLGVG